MSEEAMMEAQGRSRVPGPDGPVGAVLVVGGGVGGLQASLDLAEAGFKVYLAEEASAIGGRMAQLDKTFPTNDCSMCIISPKLVEVGRHPDIEVLTLTEVLGASGDAGNFRVRLRVGARYVDPRKCTGCGECIAVCPVERPNEHDLGMSTRRAIFKKYPQAVPGAYVIEKAGTAPCRDACPAGVSAQGYIALLAQGRFQEAVELVRRRLPFPGICGRVCMHPCETACSRSEVDAPVAIRDLKRFLADVEREAEGIRLPEPAPRRPERVAVVGAGPGGLSAAYFLALAGYPVTVFEALPVPGGMMAVGIPAYRLPREILQAEIDAIRSLGVEIRCGVRVGPDRNLTIRKLLEEEGYGAVLLAAGAHRSLRLGVEGEALQGVLPALDLLRKVALGEEVSVGRRAVVIGGGDAAFDAVRTALRLGAREATILYRRTRAEMPAGEEEIREALEEGVTLKFLAAPVRILGRDGRVVGLECIGMELGEPDESGRPRPVPRPGTEFVIEADTVIPAIGQALDPHVLEGEERERLLSSRGRIQADPQTCATPLPGVFACGDAVTGPASIIEAVGAGREAAISIDRFLRGVPVAEGRERTRRVAPRPPLEDVARSERARPPELPGAGRLKGFDEVRQGFTPEQAVAEAARCLSCGVCCECDRCAAVCEPGAIDHEMEPREIEIEVGSIVLAPGFELFDPALAGEYGYGRWTNVVSGLQFERLLSATGPTDGDLRRPSDGRPVTRVAWIQCVGSRDRRHGLGYCSAVCCMAAAKQATVAREHHPDLSAAIFFIDQRAQGKGFDAYVERAAEAYGVRFVRCMISGVDALPDSQDLQLQYVEPDGTPRTEVFDMVVLSAGMRPSEKVRELAGRIGVDLDPFGFCHTRRFRPAATSRPGVFVCGAFQGPKDIPETVAQASGAAAFASATLAPARHTQTKVLSYPTERDVGGEEPRVGLFVCRCGINIASVVDVPAVVEYGRSLPGVVMAEEALFSCSEDSLRHIGEQIAAHGLNRVVVASCSPRTHEPLFRLTLREAGLNPYLFDMANIRDQCSWVHQGSPERATLKAMDLVRSAVARVRMLDPLQEQELPVAERALVIGGGLAGMTASLLLARQGFPVTLLEREEELGGNLRRLRSTFDGEDVAAMLERLRGEVRGEPRITVLSSAEVVSFSGFVGAFESEVMAGGGVPRTIRHGVTLLATGGRPIVPEGFLYGGDPRVSTQLDLEERLAGDGPLPRRVAMIQCVGSRCDERPYCSRVCCGQAVKNALRLLEREPGASVFILYRDMRTYGLAEDLYARAREAGVLFLRYDPGAEPQVAARDGGLEVRLEDPTVGRLALPVDEVVLAPAIEPSDVEELARLLKVARSGDGFFLEAHQKLRPVDMASDGIFVCGVAHGPKPVDETVAQAAGAAARAATILAKGSVRVGGSIGRVDPERCAACLTCVRICPYEVPSINADGKAEIEPARCQGCGLCAAECPGLAIELMHFTERQLLAQCRAVLGEVSDAGL